MQMPLIFWFQLLIMLVLKSRVAGFTSCFKATSYSFFAIGRLHATSFADLSSTLAKHTTQLFDLQLPEGRCVALELHPNDEESSLQNWSDPSHWVHQCLHPVEIEYGKHLTKTVRKSFLLGRLAMRVCLQHTEPCLKDLKGRPLLPKGQLGSISHKGLVGVALSTCVDGSTKPIAIGVDIEQHSSNKRSVASRILTKSEIQDLGRLKHQNISSDEEVMLRFSLKEAIYKAINPLIHQYVGFQEAEVTPWEDGTATVKWNLESGADQHFDSVVAHWRRLDRFFLTSARCILKTDQEKE